MTELLLVKKIKIGLKHKFVHIAKQGNVYNSYTLTKHNIQVIVSTGTILKE